MSIDAHATMLKASQNKNVLSCRLKAAWDDVLRIDLGSSRYQSVVIVLVRRRQYSLLIVHEDIPRCQSTFGTRIVSLPFETNSRHTFSPHLIHDMTRHTHHSASVSCL